MITVNSNNLFYNETYRSTVEIFDVQLDMHVVKRKLTTFFLADVVVQCK